jgi:hypothetical protein
LYEVLVVPILLLLCEGVLDRVLHSEHLRAGPMLHSLHQPILRPTGCHHHAAEVCLKPLHYILNSAYFPHVHHQSLPQPLPQLHHCLVILQFMSSPFLVSMGLIVPIELSPIRPTEDIHHHVVYPLLQQILSNLKCSIRSPQLQRLSS